MSGADVTAPDWLALAARMLAETRVTWPWYKSRRNADLEAALAEREARLAAALGRGIAAVRESDQRHRLGDGTRCDCGVGDTLDYTDRAFTQWLAHRDAAAARAFAEACRGRRAP